MGRWRAWPRAELARNWRGFRNGRLQLIRNERARHARASVVIFRVRFEVTRDYGFDALAPFEADFLEFGLVERDLEINLHGLAPWWCGLIPRPRPLGPYDPARAGQNQSGPSLVIRRRDALAYCPEPLQHPSRLPLGLRPQLRNCSALPASAHSSSWWVCRARPGEPESGIDPSGPPG